MRADGNLLPAPSEAAFYVRYVEVCRRLGVDPDSPERIRELVSKWNRILGGEQQGQAD